GMVKTRTADETMRKLEAVVPEKYRLNAHHWLILHGRYVCVARRSNCPSCILRDLCEFPDKTPAEAGTTLKAKTRARPKAAKKAPAAVARTAGVRAKPRGRATV